MAVFQVSGRGLTTCGRSTKNMDLKHKQIIWNVSRLIPQLHLFSIGFVKHCKISYIDQFLFLTVSRASLH